MTIRKEFKVQCYSNLLEKGAKHSEGRDGDRRHHVSSCRLDNLRLKGSKPRTHQAPLSMQQEEEIQSSWLRKLGVCLL